MTRWSLIAAFLLAATGCTRQAPVVDFTTICAPPEDPTTCTFSESCDAQYIGEALVDLGQVNRLWLVVETRNQVVDASDAGAGRRNGQDAHLQEIRVDYGGALGLANVSTRVAQTIPAEGTAAVSVFLEGLGAAAVPAGTTQLVVAKVRGRGVFGDGTSFETPPWEVPVKLCVGCIGPVPACPTAGDVVFTCPPTWGQTPLSAECATP